MTRTGQVTFSCFGCAYACAIASPFEDWIWCHRPGDSRLVNLTRDCSCRRKDGGITLTRDTDEDRESAGIRERSSTAREESP